MRRRSLWSWRLTRFESYRCSVCGATWLLRCCPELRHEILCASCYTWQARLAAPPLFTALTPGARQPEGTE